MNSKPYPKSNCATNLKRIRKKLGVSQDQLATKIGVSKSMISRVESGERNLNAENLKKAASALMCSVKDLTG